MTEVVNIKSFQLREEIYQVALDRWGDENLAKAVSDNFHNSGLHLIIESTVNVEVSDTLDVYTRLGKIKGVVAGLEENIKLARADKNSCAVYVATNEPNGATIITIRYND